MIAHTIFCLLAGALTVTAIDIETGHRNKNAQNLKVEKAQKQDAQPASAMAVTAQGEVKPDPAGIMRSEAAPAHQKAVANPDSKAEQYPPPQGGYVGASYSAPSYGGRVGASASGGGYGAGAWSPYGAGAAGGAYGAGAGSPYGAGAAGGAYGAGAAGRGAYGAGPQYGYGSPSFPVTASGYGQASGAANAANTVGWSAGAQCDIPKWNNKDYMCREAADVLPMNAYFDKTGTEHRLLNNGQRCTCNCPAAKWYQSANVSSMTCRNGGFVDSNNNPVNSLKCGLAKWVYVIIGVFLLMVASCVIISCWVFQRGKHKGVPVPHQEGMAPGYDGMAPPVASYDAYGAPTSRPVEGNAPHSTFSQY